MKVKWFYILILLFSSNSFAGITVAKITNILFVETGTKGLVYVYPEGGVSNPPSCHGANGDYFSFKADRPMAQEYISALLMAFAAQKNVTFTSAGACNDQSVSDTLRYFVIHR